MLDRAPEELKLTVQVCLIRKQGGTVCLAVHTFEILILSVSAFYDRCHFQRGNKAQSMLANKHFRMIWYSNVTRIPCYFP
jgi:hypothetical protein